MERNSDNARELALRGTCLTAIAVLMIATPAIAAESSGNESSVNAGVQPGATSGDTKDGAGLQEIVVTAQHRSENLQKVPIAVNAITGDQLKAAGISDTTALVQSVPSLDFTRSGPSGIFVIRGVGTPNGAAGEEGSTAVYVDDVYMPDLAQAVNNFNNIARVEVLNGPQGTLFGRNATAGLVHIITQDPADHTEFKGQIGYGNYDTASGQAYFTTPLAENVGWDIAFTGQNQGKGFGYDPTIGKDVRKDNYWGLRSKLVFKPAPDVKITLAGDYYNTHDSTATYIDPIPASAGLASSVASQNSDASFPGFTHIQVWGVSGKAEVNLGFANLISVTAYRDLTNTSSFGADGTAIDFINLTYHSTSESFQQEIRLASTKTEPFSWQVGAFYLHAVSTNVQNQGGLIFALTPTADYGPFAGTFINAKGVTNSVAGFGEGTYAITPTTHLTAGLRWTSDRRQVPIGTTTVYTLPGSPIYPYPIVQTQQQPDATFDQLTYRAALRQDLTDHINAYASVNRGFKAGEFDLQTPAAAPVRPETIMAYEVGLKSELLDRRLRLNVAAYHYDISNYQIRSALGGVSVLANAAKVKVDGIDINAEAAVTNEFHVTTGATWLKSYFSQYGGPGALYVPVNAAGVDFNATGNQTALAPHFTLDIGANYTIPTGGDSSLRLSANFTHKSNYYFEADDFLHQPAYNEGNASVTYQVNRNVAVEAWMRNIGNTLYNVQMVSYGFAQAALAAPPRTFGGDVKVSF